jgi:very-short-patch-repair endonuclease
MLDRAGLPRPEPQVEIYDPDGFIARADFVYPDQKLILAGHSKQWHWGELAESKDLAQHNRLSALGYKILYLTWADVTRGREGTVSIIRSILVRAA